MKLHQRLRQSVYWEEPASEVRRCSWFYKGEGDSFYLPYDEITAATLEVSSYEVTSIFFSEIVGSTRPNFSCNYTCTCSNSCHPDPLPRHPFCSQIIFTWLKHLYGLHICMQIYGVLIFCLYVRQTETQIYEGAKNPTPISMIM